MISVFSDYYFAGFASGVGLSIIVMAVFFVIYFREKRKSKERLKAQEIDSAEAPAPTWKKAAVESGCYICISLVLAAIVYLWITPFMPYSGIVEDKSRWASGRKTKVITYYLQIDGEKRAVSKNVFEIANKGDTVSHPPAAQFYNINGKRYMAEDFASNTGFWLGIIFTFCFALCGGAYYRFRKIKKMIMAL